VVQSSRGQAGYRFVLTRYPVAVSVFKHINFGNLTESPRNPVKIANGLIAWDKSPQCSKWIYARKQRAKPCVEIRSFHNFQHRTRVPQCSCQSWIPPMGFADRHCRDATLTGMSLSPRYASAIFLHECLPVTARQIPATLTSALNTTTVETTYLPGILHDRTGRHHDNAAAPEDSAAALAAIPKFRSRGHPGKARCYSEAVKRSRTTPIPRDPGGSFPGPVVRAYAGWICRT